MTDATCKTCPSWCLDGRPHQRGQCRRHAPVFNAESAYYMGLEAAEPLWPVTLSDEWCGEHPGRKVQVSR